MTDSHDNQNPLDAEPFDVPPQPEAGLSEGAPSSDPNGLPELSELSGITGLSEVPVELPALPLTSNAIGVTGKTPAFIDEIDFGPRLSDPKSEIESALQQRRRIRRELRRREQRDTIWNALTVIVWLGMACSLMAFASIYTNSHSPLNIFRKPMPTLVAAVVLPSATPTPLPSPTSVVRDTPVATATTRPTATATSTPEPTETQTPGPSPTPTIYSLYPYILRGDVKVIPAATFPDHDACKLWVAGQVYDLQGAPMTGVTVMLGGNINYKTLTSLSLTGTALQYGPAGYEFTLADQPVKSTHAVWVMLFNQSMVPLSNKIYFDTVDDCQQNLILINFRQVK